MKHSFWVDEASLCRVYLLLLLKPICMWILILFQTRIETWLRPLCYIVFHGDNKTFGLPFLPATLVAGRGIYRAGVEGLARKRGEWRKTRLRLSGRIIRLFVPDHFNKGWAIGWGESKWGAGQWGETCTSWPSLIVLKGGTINKGWNFINQKHISTKKEVSLEFARQLRQVKLRLARKTSMRVSIKWKSFSIKWGGISWKDKRDYSI